LSGSGPGGVDPPFPVEIGAAGEQPLPSEVASKSTEYRPSADMEVMTQFWLWRGPLIVLVPVLKSRPAAALYSVDPPLLRFMYIQPPTSPDVERGG